MPQLTNLVIALFPISTETEFLEVMARETGSASRARGPRQPVDAVADALAPGLCDRFVRRFGRQPVPLAAGAPPDTRT